MNDKLDTLVNNLPKDYFNNVKRYYRDDKLSLLTRKGVILMIIWIRQKSEKKLSYHRKKSFILNLMMRVSVMKITHTLKEFGKRLK